MEERNVRETVNKGLRSWIWADQQAQILLV